MTRPLTVEANMGLVHAVVNHYPAQVGCATRDDLVQAGAIGLMRAIERFDPERGVAFSTFAVYWIRQGIQRELANHSEVVRVPVHEQERRRKAGGSPRARVASLDAPLPTAANDGSPRTLHDRLGRGGGQLESLERAESQARVRVAVSSLSARQQRVLHQRTRDVTLATIAPELGVSRERVRQIEGDTLALVRRRLAG